MNNSDKLSKSYNFDTKILRYLVGIIDEKSLSKAAEKFYISQPALSRCLKNVETSLGIKLFIHNHNRLEPTDAGKIFINGARSLLYIEQNALQQLKELPRRNHQLSIWTEEWFYPFLKKTIVYEFEKIHPENVLEIKISNYREIQENLSNGSADIGLFWGEEIENPFFTCRTLFTSDMVFCLPDRQPSSSFLLSPRDTYLRHLQEQILQEQGIHTPNIAGELGWPLLRELLKQGYGNVILPQRLVTDCISPERISLLPNPRYCHGILGQYQGLIITEPVQTLRTLIINHSDHITMLPIK